MIAEIIGTGTFAAVVVFLLNLLRDYYAEGRAKKRKAKRQAFELSNRLKLFNIRVNEIISDHAIAEAPPNQERANPPSLPDENFLEMTRDLPDLDEDDLARLADLEIQKRVEDSFITFGWQTWMHEDDIESFSWRDSIILPANLMNWRL